MGRSFEETPLADRTVDLESESVRCPAAVMETSDEEIERAHRAVPQDVVLDIERHVSPDGAGPSMQEWMLPVLMSCMALLGVAIVGTVLGLASGWRAALLGIGAVLTGCSVSWIVVWGAGVMRAREERRASEEVEANVVELHSTIRRV